MQKPVQKQALMTCFETDPAKTTKHPGLLPGFSALKKALMVQP